MRKAVEQKILLLKAVSPDGRWLVGWSPLPGTDAVAIQAFPLAGGSPVHIAASIEWNWSPDGDFASISAGPVGPNRSYIIPLKPGAALPPVPTGGFRSEQEIADIAGARRIDAWAVPGASPGVHAFYRGTTQRNLYRIPVQ